MHLADLFQRLHFIPEDSWDCHLHGWIASKTPCIRGAGPTLEQDYTPHELEPLLQAIGIKHAVLIQAVDPHEGGPDEAKRFVEWIQKSKIIHYAVVSANLEAGADVEPELQWLASMQEIIGIRIIRPQESGVGIFGSRAFIDAANLLPKHDLHLEWLMRESNSGQLEETLSTVEQLPSDLRIMGNHLLKPIDIENGTPSMRWKSHIRALSEHSNFWIKFSALAGEAPLGTPTENFFPFYDHALNCFGPERIVFGSDYPVSALRGSYNDAIALHLSWLVASGNESIAKKLFHDNPSTFYDRRGNIPC